MDSYSNKGSEYLSEFMRVSLLYFIYHVKTLILKKSDIKNINSILKFKKMNNFKVTKIDGKNSK